MEVLLSAPVTFDLHKPTTRKDVNAMTVTVLAEIKVNPAKQDELAQYFAATMPLIERAGARILAQLNINEVVIGKNMSKSMYVVEYPSREAVYEVFAVRYAQLASRTRRESFLGIDAHDECFPGDCRAD